MAERDRFELDLAAALHAYLEDAPTEVRPTEIARTSPRTTPKRTRSAVALRATRPCLVLLLLAGLLATLVGGALLVGSQMQRKLPAVVPPVGQVFECPPGSNPDEPGPVDQARPPLSPWASAFDRSAGRLVAVAIAGTVVETWTFDVCTNTWTRMHPNREPRTPVETLVYDVDST
jgi:hypothetical protein